MKYKPKKEDLAYWHDTIAVYVPGQDVVGNIGLSLDMINGGLEIMESGDCMFMNGLADKGKRKEIINNWIIRLTNIRDED